MTGLKNKPLAVIKFLLFSFIGIAAFFVQITIGGERRIPIDHITQYLYGVFAPFYNYLVLIFCVFALLMVFFIKRTFKRSAVDLVLSIFQIIGTVLVVLVTFDATPAFLGGVAPATLIQMGRSIIMIFCTAFFLPFILNYGLIDAAGILTKPLMRPVFKTPGLTSVIVASDLFANFSAAILGTNALYKEGKLTYKEAVIIFTGFSSISIGLMLLFSQLLGITEHFLFYFFSATLVMLLVTAITVRIPPIRGLKNEYHENKPTPLAEDNLQGGRLVSAAKAAVKAADVAPPLPLAMGKFIFTILQVLANMVSASMFIIVAGLLINQYTPIFSWLGLSFYPIFAVFGIAEAGVLSTASGLAIMDVFPAVMYGASYELSLAARYILAAFPVSIIIFIGGYFTCLIATGFRIKIRHLFVLWLERMILSLIFFCAIAAIFFR